MNLEDRIELLQQQMLCVGPIYTFHYSPEGKLLGSNCPEEAVVDQAFAALKCRERMLAYARKSPAPLWVGSPIGLEWMAAAEREGETIRSFYVLGPCLNTEASHWGVEQAIHKFEALNGHQSWARPLIAIEKRFPF